MGSRKRKLLAPLIITDLSTVTKVSLLVVFIMLVSVWAWFVSIHGYPTQASSDVPCSGQLSYWGSGTSITPGLALDKADLVPASQCTEWAPRW